MAVLAWKPKTDILVGRTGNMFVFFSIWESTYDYFGPNIVGIFPATGIFSVLMDSSYAEVQVLLTTKLLEYFK